MNRPTRTSVLLLVLGAVLWATPPASADDCWPVFAEIDLSDGTIRGNLGLDGTAVFVADSSGTPPPTAPAGSTVFSGILTITTDDGVLEVRETGMFSSRSGTEAGPILSSWGDFVSGTGRYTDLTRGEIFFAGHEIDGALLVYAVGKLCRD